jgi:hypothetical protein
MISFITSPSIIQMIKSRRFWACRTHGVERHSYRILVGRPEGNRRLGRPSRRWDDNIKLDLREIGWGGMDLCGSG